MYKNLAPGALGIKATLEETLRLARDHGFEGADISIREVEALVREKSEASVREILSAAGVLPGVWGLAVSWRGTAEEYRDGLAQLESLAALARGIGAERAVSGFAPASDDRPFDENFRWHVERLRPIARILKDNGCRLGLEFIGPKTFRAGKKYDFINTLGGTLELCAEIGDNAGVLLDTFHWYTSHGTLGDLDRLTNEQVVYVHLNDAPGGVPVDEQIDNIRRLPGETGTIDVPGFLRRLAAIGYDGPVAVEPFSKEINEMPASDAARTAARSLDGVWRAAGLA